MSFFSILLKQSATHSREMCYWWRRSELQDRFLPINRWWKVTFVAQQRLLFLRKACNSSLAWWRWYNTFNLTPWYLYCSAKILYFLESLWNVLKFNKVGNYSIWEGIVQRSIAIWHCKGKDIGCWYYKKGNQSVLVTLFLRCRPNVKSEMIRESSFKAFGRFCPFML